MNIIGASCLPDTDHLNRLAQEPDGCWGAGSSESHRKVSGGSAPSISAATKPWSN